MWVGLAGIISGVVFFYNGVSPSGNAVELTIGRSLATAWYIGYFIAGLIVCYGLLRPSPRWEVAGLSLLGGATSINAVAILSHYHSSGIATGVTLFALALASWLRAEFVYLAIRRLIEEISL